jgi:hypothetical protein
MDRQSSGECNTWLDGPGIGAVDGLITAKDTRLLVPALSGRMTVDAVVHTLGNSSLYGGDSANARKYMKIDL